MNLDESVISDDSTPGATTKRSFALLVPACCVVLTYHLLFQVTKPSPLSSDMSLTALSPVLSYSILAIASFAIILLPVAVTGDLLWKRRGGRRAEVGSLTVSATVYSLGFLALLENLLYTLAGVGLKTNDSIALKAAFSIGAISLGVLTARFAARLSERRTLLVFRATLVACLPAAVVVACGLATMGAAPALPDADRFDPVNVLILSSDGIDADHMSTYGYERNTTPFLDSKMSEFDVFDNAFTNNGNTTGSITSLLTGMSPVTTGVVYPPDMLRSEDALRTLPQLLDDLGYFRSNWAVPHFADGKDQNMLQAFDVDNGHRAAASPLASLPLDRGKARWFLAETYAMTADLVLDVVNAREMSNPFAGLGGTKNDRLGDGLRLESVLGEIRAHQRFFINAHFMVTHGPWFPLRKPRFTAGHTQTAEWSRNFYDDAILEFDSNVRRVYEELRRTGKLENTILVVTSDHPMRNDASKRIPLMIRFPDGRSSGRSSVNVERLDIAPTILDSMHIAPPSWMEGESLVSSDHISSDRQIVAANVTALVDSRGYKRRNGGLLLTIIRCQSYIRLSPSGEVERGRISGSSSRCEQTPDIPSSWTGEAKAAP